MSERQLYGERMKRERKKPSKVPDPASIIADLAELYKGAPVLHERLILYKRIGACADSKMRAQDQNRFDRPLRAIAGTGKPSLTSAS